MKKQRLRQCRRTAWGQQFDKARDAATERVLADVLKPENIPAIANAAQKAKAWAQQARAIEQEYVQRASANIALVRGRTRAFELLPQVVSIPPSAERNALDRELAAIFDSGIDCDIGHVHEKLTARRSRLRADYDEGRISEEEMGELTAALLHAKLSLQRLRREVEELATFEQEVRTCVVRLYEQQGLQAARALLAAIDSEALAGYRLHLVLCLFSVDMMAPL